MTTPCISGYHDIECVPGVAFYEMAANNKKGAMAKAITP
jgi:hypothetical protein